MDPERDEEEHLIEKLRKVEALFVSATIPGERQAAASARERILQRLQDLDRLEQRVEYKFSLGDTWSKSLFIALLRRYGLEPYRYRGQRRTTVMVQVAPSFLDELLWPEFRKLSAILSEHLEASTRRIIARAIHGDAGEVEERAQQELGPTARQGLLPGQ